MADYLARVHVHFVWSTWRHLPFLTGDVEGVVHQATVRVAQQRSCHVLAVGGVEDHVHLLVWLHPACSLASLVSAVKTGSSRTVHESLHRPFMWQRGYGAFALQPRSLDAVVGYVRDQRRRHDSGATIPVLERAPDCAARVPP
ncbi:MAG: IS200/IS605 family transposase [Deltaproteobacteria bacterium]|nr:IS200/IS605 family transposase [Deltaproteobacteria bacterium]